MLGACAGLPARPGCHPPFPIHVQPPSPANLPPSLAQRAPVGPLLWITLLALVLRCLEAIESSLWLDELHTLSHASQPGLGALLKSVSSEVHTPLFFAFVQVFGGFESGAWLRAIPILSSVAMLWTLVAVARECGLGERANLWMAWLFACLPYHVLYGSELRPYAWVGWFAALAFLAAYSERGSRPARLVAFFLCILLGLLTHRVVALALLAVGAARLVTKQPRSLPLWSLIVAGTLAVAGFLPWLIGFAQQATHARFDYQESVGGYRLRPTLVYELLALPTRLVNPYMRELGAPWDLLAIVSSACFGLCALGLVALAWRARRGVPPAPALRGLMLFALVLFLVTTAFAVWTWDRVPLQYFTAMAWSLPLLLAACIERAWSVRAGRLLAYGMGAASLVMGLSLVGGKSREDMRGAVAAVRLLGAEAQAASGADPLYTALLAQPSQFENVLPYRAYARDVAPLEPDRLPHPGERGFDRPVIVLRRVVPLRDEAWLPITTGRKLVREVRVDRYLSAYWYAAE